MVNSWLRRACSHRDFRFVNRLLILSCLLNNLFLAISLIAVYGSDKVGYRNQNEARNPDEFPSRFVTETRAIPYVSTDLSPSTFLSGVPQTFVESIHDAVAAWLQKSPSEHTRKSYASDLQQFLTFLQRQSRRRIPFDHVRPIHVSAWRDQLSNNGLSNASVRRKLTTLRSAFSYLQSCGLVRLNPAHSQFVAAPPVARDGKTVGLSPQACRLLLDAPNIQTPAGIRDRAILGVLAYSACRVGELVTVRVNDYQRTGEHHVLQLIGKGRKERRVPLHIEAVERLNEWLTTGGNIDNQQMPLFRPAITSRCQGRTGFKHRPLTTKAVANIVKKHAREAGLDPAVSVHSLRVTALTIARERGADIIDLQDFAGHADPRTTLTYIRSRDRLSKSPTYILNF